MKPIFSLFFFPAPFCSAAWAISLPVQFLSELLTYVLVVLISKSSFMDIMCIFSLIAQRISIIAFTVSLLFDPVSLNPLPVCLLNWFSFVAMGGHLQWMTALGCPAWDWKEQSYVMWLYRSGYRNFHLAFFTQLVSQHTVPSKWFPNPNPGVEDKLTIVKVLNTQKRKSIILYTYLLINNCFLLRIWLRYPTHIVKCICFQIQSLNSLISLENPLSRRICLAVRIKCGVETSG